MSKIGIIGNGIHSKRIQKILSEKKLKYLIYKPSRPKYYDKNALLELKKCNIIFILSPNKTHFNYINLFKKKSYIFCEKPPTTNKVQLKKLKKANYKKIYFNFIYRFSRISEILKARKKYKVGNLIYANLVLAHGLSLMKKYQKNWRSNYKKSPQGVFENVSIHFIDLINYHFKIYKTQKPNLSKNSKFGNSYDTSHIQMFHKNKTVINIFSTYNSPYAKNLFFLFDNGIIIQKDNEISIKGPAMNFDKNGMFSSPKTIKKININYKKDYSESLKKSVSYFLSIANKKLSFNKSLFNSSLESNKILLG